MTEQDNKPAIEVEAIPETPGTDLVPVDSPESQDQLAEPDMVTISALEYKYLGQIVIDTGSMVKLMMEIKAVFADFLDGRENLTIGEVGKMIALKPGKLKKAAHQLAGPISAMAPYIQKYGRHAHTMSQSHEQSEHSTPVTVSRSESGS